MFIRTQRLFLRPGWAEDAPALARAIAHQSVVRMLARAPWPYREGDAAAFLAAPQDSRLPSLLVTLPQEGGRIIGGCGLHRGERGAAEVGYWITPSHQGRGFAREALAALIGAARLLRHRRLAGRHAIDNPASGAVLRAAGFRATGEIAPFRSRARDGAVPAMDYALPLIDGGSPPPDWTRPHAYAEGAAAA